MLLEVFQSYFIILGSIYQIQAILDINIGSIGQIEVLGIGQTLLEVDLLVIFKAY